MSFALFLWIGIINPFDISQSPEGYWGRKMSTADYMQQAFNARWETCYFAEELGTYLCETHGMLLPSETIEILGMVTRHD